MVCSHRLKIENLNFWTARGRAKKLRSANLGDALKIYLRAPRSGRGQTSKVLPPSVG